jgi:hypothetical protein
MMQRCWLSLEFPWTSETIEPLCSELSVATLLRHNSEGLGFFPFRIPRRCIRNLKATRSYSNFIEDGPAELLLKMV